jgi:hydroxymethylglutaryl-CoA lyase
LATEDLVWLAQESGFETGVDLPALMGVIEEFGRRLGQPLGGRSHAWLRRHLGLTGSAQ